MAVQTTTAAYQMPFSNLAAVVGGLTLWRGIAQWLSLEIARERVQSSGEPIERVAEVTGFGDAERMRRAFVRAFGHPPQSVRRTARAN